MAPQRILVVDDEANIRRIVTTYLRRDGFDVTEAVDGESALREFDRIHPDLVILDVMMPGIDGIEVLRRIRRRSDAYVIMLTARAEETDQVIGLTVGADDYVTKPFGAKELVARVKAVLRRSRDAGPGAGDDEVFDLGGLVVDTARREVLRDGDPVTLTALEFDLLAAMAAAPGRVFSRRQLLERVWGWDHVGDDRVVDVHIRKLRKALGDDATDPRFVATVRGVGYKVVAAR
ncbi:MAG: response regulator transcription factor [Actinobacteria bacterium]|nr:response regulator transcription factor [Actinomycetota bacterium]